MDYFTQEHFDLLNEWAKKKYDKKEPLHTSTREELKTVYKLVEDWAHSLNKSVFADNSDVETFLSHPVWLDAAGHAETTFKTTLLM